MRQTTLLRRKYDPHWVRYCSTSELAPSWRKKAAYGIVRSQWVGR